MPAGLDVATRSLVDNASNLMVLGICVQFLPSMYQTALYTQAKIHRKMVTSQHNNDKLFSGREALEINHSMADSTPIISL